MSLSFRSILAVLTLTLLATPAMPCSRYLWNNNKLGVFAARTLDWPESTEPVLTVFPRGMKRDGGQFVDKVVVSENAAKWTSKYGSLVTTVYGVGACDGLNEKGLAGHMLYLRATDYGPRDAKKAGMHAVLLLQYLLDNAADVKEAVKLLDDIQLVMVELHGFKSTIHVAIEDVSGDSAIIEYIKGKPVVHHGREYRVMTNDPPYAEQLKLLKEQDFSKPSSDMKLPGNVNPRDRFQRAAYYGALLPDPKNEREAIASVLAIARNVSVPFGAPYTNFGIYNTEYRTAINLTKLRYYFEFTTSPNVIWMDLSKFNLDAGAPVLLLNPNNVDLSGDVTGKYKKAEKTPY